MSKTAQRAVLMLCLVLTNIAIASSLSEDELTPYGAIRKGNANGSIGEWISDLAQIKEIKNKLQNESPIYKIDNNNIELHKNDVPYGLRKLMKIYPETFYLNVYNSHRTSYYHDWIYSGIKWNSKNALLTENDSAIINTRPGIPFPTPRKGIEAIWNHLLSYKGASLETTSYEAVINPEKGVRNVIISDIKFSSPYYDKERNASNKKQTLLYYLSEVVKPSRLAGNVLLLHDKVNGSLYPRQSWGYFKSSRKVSRLPSVSYDSPLFGSESIRFADEVDLFNGSPDRYDWNLLGKKELIIPYNNDNLFSAMQSEKSAFFSSYHMLPTQLRYEKHRVWIVEGRLKENAHHPYQRRTFYIDEDSWLILLAENYDKEDVLWRVSISYTQMYLELPGIFKVVDTYHDLRSGSYFIQTLSHKDGKVRMSENVLPSVQFKPGHLRRLGR